MQTAILSTLALLAATSLAVDTNVVATEIAAASSLVNALTTQSIVNPVNAAASSYDASATTKSGYIAATQYVATAVSSGQAMSEQAAYYSSLATATGSVPPPSYYTKLPSSVRTELDTYASGYQTAVHSAAKAAQTATPSTLVFSIINSTLGGTNGTKPGASGSVTAAGSGTAPGQSTVTSTSTAQGNQTSSMTTTTSSPSSSSGSATSTSSKAGAASQPTGLFKAAGAAAVGVLGLAALL